MKATLIYNEGRFEEPKTYDFPINDFGGLDPNIDQTDLLETIFRQANHVDGYEWIAGKKMRSLSVGDMVKLDNDLYVCARVGWKKVG
jgi:hypothetical protein